MIESLSLYSQPAVDAQVPSGKGPLRRQMCRAGELHNATDRQVERFQAKPDLPYYFARNG